MSKEVKFADVSFDESFVDRVVYPAKARELLAEENASLRETLRLKELECEALAGDKERLLGTAAWLHQKLIVEGRRYGASVNRADVLELLTEMGWVDNEAFNL